MYYTQIKLVAVKKAGHICLFLLLFAQGFKTIAQQIFIGDSICIIDSDNAPSRAMQQLNLSALHFIKAPDNRINFGIVANEYKYFVLKLNATANLAAQYLSMDNTSIDTVKIFQINNDGASRLLYEGGSLMVFNIHSNYVWHTAPVVINTTPSYYFIALKAAQKNINIKYQVLSSNQLQQQYQSYARNVFFYMGAVCIIIAVVLLAFFLFKHWVFVAYLGYIIFLCCWIMLHYGYLFPYVYPQLPIINEIAKPVSSLLASYFLLLVLKLMFINQLPARVWLKYLYKWILIILPILIASMSLLIIADTNATAIKTTVVVAWHAGLFVSIAVIVFTPFYFIRSGFTAKLFSFTMLLVCAMLMVQLLANSGIINNFIIGEHGAAMGSLLESFIMAFGLFHNLLADKKQQEKQVLVLQKEQNETLKKLITVQDNERKRIAGDLHDNIGPLLAALKINFRRIIQSKEKDMQNKLISKTESIIDDSITEIRNVAHNLMPKGLSANGLINTLTEYFDGIQQLYRENIVFTHHIDAVLNPDLQINVYRIICELVLNASKHSNASIITINIKADANFVCLSIGDNGKGFQPKKGDGIKCLGLQNTESRILYLKGKYCLTSKPGTGTIITMEIPLQLYKANINGF